MDYKKYSLERLEEWMHNAISSAEASPQEIYDVIKGVVQEQYYYFKYHTGRCSELLALLNGNGKGHLSCDKDDPSPECKGAWNDFWEENYNSQEQTKSDDIIVDNDKLEKMQEFWTKFYEEKENLINQELNKKKWFLPIEVDGLSGECYVNFPDDLLEAANLKEGDQIEWIDNQDGSYKFQKVTRQLSTISSEEC